MQFAPSAFLASAAVTHHLVQLILPAHLKSLPMSKLDEALTLWSQGHEEDPLTGTAAGRKASWDSPRFSGSAEFSLQGLTI